MSASRGGSNNLTADEGKVQAIVKEGRLLDVEPLKSSHAPTPMKQLQTLNCRSFWNAGSDEALHAPSYRLDDKLEPSEFERARVHPKFLHSNATSHTWAFGAIAELLDNAVDEICNGASFIKVDKIPNPRDGSPVLLFQDDGGGMDPEGIRKCMSLGFSTKKASKTIGQYGNGFKTSTMRLGSDAIVFTCSSCGSCRTQSIGLLSYTYLVKTVKNDIIVPIADFKFTENQAVPLMYSSKEDWDNDLKVIVDWSPFTSQAELMKQFEDIGSHGTKIFVYNLWFDDDGRLELDFDDIHDDIKLRDNAKAAAAVPRVEIIQSHISYTYRFSLRAYISILYLREYPNFRIILRGKPVEHLNLASEMKFVSIVPYRPYVGKDDSVDTTIGFTKEAPFLGTYGFNIYHKNRLIVAFCKPLEEPSVRGKCVVGFLEANFLEPAHDKQDFERSPLFLRLTTKLRLMTIDYWKAHCHLIGYQSSNPEIRAKQKQAKQLSQVPKPSTLPVSVPSSSAIVGVPALQVSFPVKRAVACTPTDMLAEVPVEHTGLDLIVVQDDDLSHEESGIYSVDPSQIDKITKENVHLSIRHDECQARQEELKKYIVKLEEELEETRRKCSRVSMEIEMLKKQKISGN